MRSAAGNLNFNPAPEVTRAERIKKMKKIINNKLYDTDTAKAVSSRIDLGSVEGVFYGKTLYRKRTGEYFVYREGYRDMTDGIEPLSYDEARCWAEEHLDVEEYEAEFGLPDEGERTALNLSLSASTAEKARRAAAKKKITVSAYIERLIEEKEN